jgi:hypothetical protein
VVVDERGSDARTTRKMMEMKMKMQRGRWGGGLAIVDAWLVVDGMADMIGHRQNGYLLCVLLLKKGLNG